MSKSKAIIYIDGENFLHRVEDSLKVEGIISKKEQITAFALKDFFKAALPDFKSVEIRYYGTKIRTYDITDKNILKHAQTMVESQRRLKRNFMNQGIDFIISGSLRLRETTCYKCKQRSFVFKEKGVDVRLAVDLVTESSPKLTQIVVSSDSDLLPAIKHIKDISENVVYVHHAEKPNYAMIKASKETRVFTKQQIIKAYKEANK